MCAARQRGLENLGRVFNQLRRSEKWGHHLSSHPIFKIWGDVVGEAVAEVARPVSFKRGILRVEVSDPAWIQELHLMSGEILAKLREVLEGNEIKTIQLQAGGGAADSTRIDRSGHSQYASRMLPPEAMVSSGDKIAILESLDTFDDPKLRESIKHLIKRLSSRVLWEDKEKPNEREK